MAHKPFPATQRASVSDAKLAYFEGDFERCLEICANVRVRTLPTASEIALLTARAYLRTGRPREAQETIAASVQTHSTLEAALTAQMLSANAYIRQGDPDTGLALLGDAATRAADVHVMIRSEIAFSTALAHWAKRDIDAAQTFLSQVDSRSDIIHARALELQAWCHVAQRDYRRSVESFHATLLRLDSCQAGDRAIAATAISSLAIYAAEFFDAEIAHFVEGRAGSIEWSSGLAVQRYLTLSHQALYAEFSGQTIAAYQIASLALEHAPTVAFECIALSLHSTIARNAGEAFSAVVYAERARARLATLDVADLAGEERFSMLAVAECCAHFDAEFSADLFARYWGLVPVDRMLALSGDPRLTADETFIEGVISDAQRDSSRAERCFRKAFEIFNEIGYVRRAVIAAHALLKFVPSDAALRTYVRSAVDGTTNYISKAAPIRAADPFLALAHHPLVARLPKGQREVVLLICQGKTNREIARTRGVGEQTIKNMLTKHIFRTFGVSSRAALVSACLRERAVNV